MQSEQGGISEKRLLQFIGNRECHETGDTMATLLSNDQREILHCVLHHASDLLVEGDVMLLTNLQRASSNGTEDDCECTHTVCKLKRAYSWPLDVVFSLVIFSVIVSLVVLSPSHGLVTTLMVVLGGVARGAPTLANRRQLDRERGSIIRVMEAMRAFVQMIDKVMEFIEETSDNGELKQADRKDRRTFSCSDSDSDSLYKQHVEFEEEAVSGVSCTWLKTCVARSMMDVTSCIATSSRSVISGSRRLIDMAIVHDCFAQAYFTMDSSNDNDNVNYEQSTSKASTDRHGSYNDKDYRNVYNCGDSSEDEPVSLCKLQRLKKDLVVHCSEYLKLVALAHSLGRVHSARPAWTLRGASRIALHERLSRRLADAAAIVRANYYLTMYAYNADEQAHERVSRRMRKLGEVHAGLVERASTASGHMQRALRDFALLDTASLDALKAKEILERIASTLNRAQQCVASVPVELHTRNTATYTELRRQASLTLGSRNRVSASPAHACTCHPTPR